MHKENKLKAIVAIAVALAFMLPTAAVFANDDNVVLANTIVRFEPPSQTVEKGEEFTASYYIEPTDWVIGANFVTISFDPTLLQVNMTSQVTEGPFFGGAMMFEGGTVNNTAGTIKDGYALVLPGDAVNANGSLFVIHFIAQNKLGTSNLTMSGVTIKNNTGVDIPVTVQSGSVTVEEYFDLTINVVGSGTTDPVPGVHTYTTGTVVDLEAFPDSCWDFAGWSGDSVDPAMGPFFDEDFEGTFLPTGWTMTVGAFPPGQGGWKRNDQYGQPNYAGGNGFSACAHTDGCSGFLNNKLMHTELISPVMDLSSESAAELSFKASFKISPTVQVDYASVEISIDNGVMWTNILYWSVTEHDPTGPGEDVVIDLTPYVGNSQVKIKWVYDAKWNHLTAVPGHFQIDDVKVSVLDPHLGTITMDSDKEITATFTEIYYDLTMSVVGSGTTTPAPGVHSYPCGTNVSLEAFAYSCWEFAGWSGDKTTMDNPTYIIMDSNKAVTATFTEIYYDLTMSVVGSGTTTPVVGVHSILCGTVVPIEAFPAFGWSFAGWSGDATGMAPTTVTMDGNKAVTATFKEEWLAGITIEGDIELPTFGPGTIHMADYVYFGEKASASDGIDGFDLPYPGTPPAPYVAGWFMTGFVDPYDELEKDIRFYPEVAPNEKIWDLWVETDTADTVETVDITMSWNNIILQGNEYDYVILRDYLSGVTLKDMRAFDTFMFTADHGMGYHFEIVCGWNHCPVAVDDEYDAAQDMLLIVAAPGVKDNDYDDEGNPFDAVNPSDPPHGTLNSFNTDGSFEYEPDPGYSGMDSFTYEVTDGVSCFDEATVTITVLRACHIDVNIGWNLISIPASEENFDKTNFFVEFPVGSDVYYSWADAITNGYILDFIYGWTGGASGVYFDEAYLDPGEGYWLWAYEDCTLIIYSDAPEDNHITTFDDGAGWYLVGAPYMYNLAKWNTWIHYAALDYSWTQASNPTNNIILEYLYDWNRATQNYDVSENPDFFESGRGYWMYVYKQCSLKKA